MRRRKGTRAQSKRQIKLFRTKQRSKRQKGNDGPSEGSCDVPLKNSPPVLRLKLTDAPLSSSCFAIRLKSGLAYLSVRLPLKELFDHFSWINMIYSFILVPNLAELY